VGLARATVAASAVPLPSEIDGVSVEFLQTGKPTIRLPIYFVSPGQINVQMPFGIDTTGGVIRVKNADGLPVSM
jgi:uncharacterized protein (TIGR03437 family)